MNEPIGIIVAQDEADRVAILARIASHHVLSKMEVVLVEDAEAYLKSKGATNVIDDLANSMLLKSMPPLEITSMKSLKDIMLPEVPKPWQQRHNYNKHTRRGRKK